MVKSTKANKKTSAAPQPKFHEKTIVRCVVTHQGAPIINGAVLIKQSKDVVCINIDCKSKYCEVDSHFSGGGRCGIYISANERSLDLKNGVDKDEPTRATFPDFVEWDVFATNSGRYTISVCLIKR